MTLPASLRLGAVHLTVRDLERSLAFYSGPIGPPAATPTPAPPPSARVASRCSSSTRTGPRSPRAGVVVGHLHLHGYGWGVGDFGVAYIVAHEYAHNLQQELGFFRTGGRGRSTRPFELQADCMAGLWGNSVYREGKLQPGDVEEAMSTALAVGDFDYGNEQHHGTPEERRDAWLLGFEGGDPADCARFVPAV